MVQISPGSITQMKLVSMTQTVAPHVTARLHGPHLVHNTGSDAGHVLSGVVRFQSCTRRRAVSRAFAGAPRRQSKAIVRAAVSSGDDPLSSVSAKSELKDKLQGVEVFSADAGE